MELNDLYIKVLGALQTQHYNSLAEIIHDCSDNANSNKAIIFLKSNLPFKELICINSLASDCLYSYNYDYAEVFSKACLERVNELNSSGTDPTDKDFGACLKDALFSLLKIYSKTGRYQEGINLYGNFYNQYTSIFNYEIFTDAHFEALEIYLSSGNIEKAMAILSSLDTSTMPPPRILRFNQLQNKIEQLTSSVTELAEDLLQKQINKKSQSSNDIVNSLDYFTKEAGFSIDPDALQIFEEQLKTRLGSNDTAENFSRSTHAFENIYSLLKGTSSGERAHTKDDVSYRLQQTQKILVDPVKGKSKPYLQQAATSFNELLIECEENNYQEDINNIIWSIFLCYWRLQEYKKAAGTLEKLKVRLEVLRVSIADINKRAGVFHAFPHFFPSLAESYYRDGNSVGLFITAEASKGRNLADKILLNTGKETAGAANPDIFFEIIQLTKQHSFHYLSLFTDEEHSFSILITSEGKIIAVQVAIGHKQLEQWVKKDYADPNSWLSPKSAFFSKKVDMSSTLTPFLSPVEMALQDGLITPDDHIVYSPDSYLHLFPLQYIKQSNGRYLIEDFSLSKVHSGVQLIQLLSDKPAQIYEVMTVTTAATNDDEMKAKDFEVVKTWLKDNIENCTAVKPEVSSVLKALNRNQLIHFATHGSFPKTLYPEAVQNNPFYSSGLLLCFQNTQPSLDACFNYYKTENLLNPKKLEEAKCNLQHSHVSIQACVSGRSREGAAGDALGLEWAFFSSGVTSLISAHWDIDVNTYNKFFLKFYEYWLKQKLSKAKACRQAVRDMMKNEAGDNLPVFDWGGLTLSGDFR